MTCSLVKYDWPAQAEPASSDISGVAYISREDFLRGSPLYFLYTQGGRFVSIYWSESEARLAAASEGLDCEPGVRQSTLPALAREPVFESGTLWL